MRNPIDIVAELVSRIDYSLSQLEIAEDINGDPVYVIENPDGTYYFETCDIKYLNKFMKVNGVKVVSIEDLGDRFKVTVQTQVSVPLMITQPRYYHGTAIAVNDELKQLETKTTRPNVYPMIYFPETRKSTRYFKESVNEFEADCRLVFAVNYLNGWTAKELKDYCINPMLQLLGEFENVVNNDLNITIESYSVEQFSKLGEKVEGKGTIYNAINDFCSGIVVDFQMLVKNDFVCTCCCP